MAKKKKCTKCKRRKPLEQFYRNKKAKDGRQELCGKCSSERRVQYYQDNRDEQLAKKRDWRRKYPEKPAELQERRRANRKSLLKRRGLTPKQYEAMLEVQQGLCAICQKPETQFRHGRLQELSVDHDHESGEVRALLCGHCNRMLGLAGENPEVLRVGADYLESYSQ